MPDELTHERLQQEAEAAMIVGPFSVMDKPLTPPSGDKHDYMSLAPYWWPNPDTRDGLPYVRRDGEVNPERWTLDNNPFREMTRAVHTLARASLDLPDKRRYAERAVYLMRVWFLDPATRMNPHLEYGQAIPGVCDGRGIGIIDTALAFPEFIDSLTFLHTHYTQTYPGLPEWEDTREGIRRWLGAYFKWNLTSEKGQDEAQQHNNHGTWYDVQTVSIARYLPHPEERRILYEAIDRRIRAHILPDGSQPHELVRTRSYSYSVMNLRGLMHLAEFSRDGYLWKTMPADDMEGKPLLLRALRFLLPAALGEAQWAYPQITPFDASSALLPLTRQAALAYPDAGLHEVTNRLQSVSVYVLSGSG